MFLETNRKYLKKTLLAIFCALVISFLILGLLIQNSDSLNYKKSEYQRFFSEFNSEENLILIIGSSHVGQLNTELINERVSAVFPGYKVLNLAISGDSPNNRVNMMDEIIRLKPKMVVYGISYRDFDIDSQYFLPDPKWIFDDFLLFVFKESRQLGVITKIDPNGLTRDIIRNISPESEVREKESEQITFEDTPFYTFVNKQFRIANDSEIREDAETDLKIEGRNRISVQFHPLFLNREITDFKSIINRLQENEIRTIVFTTPLHRYYLEHIPVETHEDFLNILREINVLFRIEIFDMTEKYDNEKIWMDMDHIAHNRQANQYSEDIANIIIMGLK